MVDEDDISKHMKQGNVALKSFKAQHRFRRGQLVTAAVIANDGSGREVVSGKASNEPTWSVRGRSNSRCCHLSSMLG